MDCKKPWVALGAFVVGLAAAKADRVFFSSSPPVQPVPEVAGPYDGCQCTEQAMQIAWSLDNQPQQWTSDGFVASRRGIYVWVANGAYGIRVANDRDGLMSHFASPAWEPRAEDQELIARAYKRWTGTHALHAWDIQP